MEARIRNLQIIGTGRKASYNTCQEEGTRQTEWCMIVRITLVFRFTIKILYSAELYINVTYRIRLHIEVLGGEL
jgi:hypothetical protein